MGLRSTIFVKSLSMNLIVNTVFPQRKFLNTLNIILLKVNDLTTQNGYVEIFFSIFKDILIDDLSINCSQIYSKEAGLHIRERPYSGLHCIIR